MIRNFSIRKFGFDVTIQAHSINWELSVAYTIIKLSAYSIRDSTYKSSMDCGKFHMMRYMMLLLSTGKSECQQSSHRLNHCSCIEQ